MAVRGYPGKRLTPPEEEILRLVGQGLTGPEIARRLHKSLETVKSQKLSLMGKLEAKTMSHAVAIYYQRAMDRPTDLTDEDLRYIERLLRIRLASLMRTAEVELNRELGAALKKVLQGS